jgi:hypothetical protein
VEKVTGTGLWQARSKWLVVLLAVVFAALMGGQAASAAPGVPWGLTVSPLGSTVKMGTDQTLTATMVDDANQPVAGAPIHFTADAVRGVLWIMPAQPMRPGAARL